MPRLPFLNAPAASRPGPQAIVEGQAASDRQPKDLTAQPKFQAAHAARPVVEIENVWRRSCCTKAQVRRRQQRTVNLPCRMANSNSRCGSFNGGKLTDQSPYWGCGERPCTNPD